MIKELHNRLSILIVDSSHKRSTSAVFFWGGSLRKKKRQARSILIIVRMKHSKVYWGEALVVLTIDVDILKDVFDLVSVATFDVRVKKAPVNNGDEKAPS